MENSIRKSPFYQNTGFHSARKKPSSSAAYVNARQHQALNELSVHCIHAICTGLYWWTWSDLIFNRNTLLISCTTLPGYPCKQCHQKSVCLFLEQGYFNKKKKKKKIKSSIFHNFTLQLFSSMSSPAWPYISPSH